MRVELKFYQPIVLAILFHFLRKLAISNDALLFIQQHHWQVDLSTFYNNTSLAEAVAAIDEIPAFLMLNKHAVNVTLNWLCNVVNFQNVHNRLIILAFDIDTYETLKRAWPNLHVLHWKIPVMDRRFRAGDGRYQMFQLLRSNLCAYLASLGRDFWMIQSDTYWRENLFEIVDPKLMLNDDENLLFDQEGSNGLLAEMIAGGNYFIKADQRSVLFFNELSRRLITYYSTDNNIMGGLCSYRYAGNKCSFIPYQILSNWRWHNGEKKHLPLLMQFDGGAGSDSKLQKMQQLGAAFVIPETLGGNQQARCNYSISQIPECAISKRGNTTALLVDFHVDYICTRVDFRCSWQRLFVGNIFDITNVNLVEAYYSAVKLQNISIPNNSQLHCVSWMQNLGYVATGGTDGVLKVLKLAPTTYPRASSGPTNLSVNQNLDGHSGTVQVAAWNEAYQKLTTSDSNGLIIVWLTQRDSWYEEMINNRNKSVVVDMAWSHNGTKIAIAYEDGQVIVGSVDGNRLWSKDITGNLVAVCWSNDSSLLLFGMADGEVHAYDASGTFVQKVHMVCLENVELETALTKDLRRDSIISMQWYVPALASKVYDGRPSDIGGGKMNPSSISRLTVEAATHPLFRGHVPEDRPRFLVAYKHGVVQLMRNENDANSIVIKLPNVVLSKARWSPDGSLLAICGLQTDLDAEKCVVHFVTAYGERQRVLQVPGQTISDLTWEGGGLRICMAVDTHLFFANIRPNYTWAYCGQTVVYSYDRSEQNEHCVVFFETKLEESYQKYVKQLVHITAFEDHCVIVNRADDQAGTYFMQICNGIGTPVDSKYIDLEPKFVAMNASEVLVASTDAFFLWRYVIPRSSFHEPLPVSNNTNDLIYHVDDVSSKDTKSGDTQRRPHRQHDLICAVSISEKFFIICRESGTVHRYSLPQVTLQGTFTLGCRIERMELNCNGTRLAVLSSQGMKLFEITENSASVMHFDRKDIWSIKWDTEKEDTIAVMEKTRMYVVRNTECEEPIVNSGYICSFKNLTVRTVLLDEIMKSPENPDKCYIVDVEIKSLRGAKNLLEKMKIQEASAFIEKNSHPKLWALLAEVALSRLDTATAEHAYVMLKDYAGIQLIKRINSIQQEDFKRAEIAVFFGRVDEAEKIYMDHDRRDLAIAMRRKINDWFRIMEIVQRSSGPGDDQLLKQACNHVGDYYADRQNWAQAAIYYEKGENYDQLIRCYLMNDNYEKLENLSKHLPDGHELLKMIGEIFGGAGLCEQAVNCYLRCDLLNDALDVCIQLNQWDSAVQLSKTHNLRDVDALLGKYAEHLTGSNEKTLAAVQLYRRAGKFLEAARIVFDIANDERKKQAQPLRLKKLYVLGALLVEQYHNQNKAEIAKDSHHKTGAEVALNGLLEEDNALSLADSSLIDEAWRGAEAYHFYMLAQHQLYEGEVDAAMKTALHLTDFDDILDAVEVFSLLALASCAARQFSVCSRAFIKLESLTTISPQERDAYSKLALTIFTKYPPKDSRLVEAECTGCDAHIRDYCQMCPNCDTKFPTCIVSGRPLLDYQFWLCPTCKHRAYEQEISSMRYCPLCHGDI